MEGKVEELEKMLKESIERLEGIEQIGDRLEVSSMVSSGGRGSRATSVVSMVSEGRYSEKNLGRIRILTEREKEERKNNTVIKGIGLPKEIEEDKKRRKERAKGFLREKIGIECKVEYCRSGTVIIVKLDREETKREIMRNKNKLKWETIYIENDLTWEERKIQERISRWAKIQKGKEVKIRMGRVKIDNAWRLWADIEREENREEGNRKEEGIAEGKDKNNNGNRIN